MDEAREAAWSALIDATPTIIEETCGGVMEDAFDAGWDAGVTWAREQHQPRPIIACGGCGMRTDAGGADGSFICPHCFAVNRIKGGTP